MHVRRGLAAVCAAVGLSGAVLFGATIPANSSSLGAAHAAHPHHICCETPCNCPGGSGNKKVTGGIYGLVNRHKKQIYAGRSNNLRRRKGNGRERALAWAFG
jgi:hypothetical protein